LDNTHFLSHRLRGFDTVEASLKALKSASASSIPYLEIDTRVSADTTIYVHHDDLVQVKGDSVHISKSSSATINAFLQKHALDIPTLDEFLALFAQRTNRAQILMIDIKDFGYEKEHHGLVQKYDLFANIAWVSWLPQTLLALERLDPKSTKILSYLPLTRFFAFFLQKIPIIKLPLIPIVLIGPQSFKADLGTNAKGFQHAYLTQKLPKELINILSKNGGGVCISKNFLSQDLLAFNREHHLKTAVFSAKNRSEYSKLVAFGADIIFCDFIDKKVWQ